jgi:hypothetical protein
MRAENVSCMVTSSVVEQIYTYRKRLKNGIHRMGEDGRWKGIISLQG